MQPFSKVRRSNRGVKACPKCRTLNGHRSIYCKNIDCFQTLKCSGKNSDKPLSIYNDFVELSKTNVTNVENPNEINEHLINSVNINKPSDDALYMDWDNPFSDLSTSVKFPNHNALLEIHAESSSGVKMEKKSTYQLNDIILVEADKNSTISEVCDVFFAENADNKSEKPIDIQIMLAESSDLESSDLRFSSIEETYPLLNKTKSCIKRKYSSNSPNQHKSIICDSKNTINEHKIDDSNAKIISNLDNELLFLNLCRSGEYYIMASNEDETLHSSNLNSNDQKDIKNDNNLEDRIDLNLLSDHITNLSKIQKKSDVLQNEISRNFVESNGIKNSTADNLISKESTDKVSTHLDVDDTNLSFLQWLTSVTEQLNQTMHFQFNGDPKPLIHQIPHTFFECLCDRMSLDKTKRRLPNTITRFQRHDSLPLGKFTRYTWKILKINQLKRIFDTPKIPLKVLQYFKQNPNGTYTNIEHPKMEKEKYQNDVKIKNFVNIRPGYLVTYLKVGIISEHEKTPSPFCIEWIPDILPISKVGELTLKFQYGHKSNYRP